VDTAAVATGYLLYFILPLWIATGLCDWLCHRRGRIEANAGAKESLIHLLMLGEAGVAVLAGLFFAVNSLVILILLIAWALHEATSMWDLVYANSQREISAIEQRVHDYLGVIPLLALSLVLIVHWDAFIAIFGLGDRPADWALRPRLPDVSPVYLAAFLAMVALNVALFMEELWRGLRYRAPARA
jgi:hypothetical protein